MTYTEAATAAILEEMRIDTRVFVMGEDVQAVTYAQALREFGAKRIRNTPISETGFIGAGIGAALTGMRPVVEASVSTFLYSAMDQIANQAAKSRYMFGGQASVPIVVRATVLYSGGSAAHHSDRPWGLFAQVPGLRIIVPTTPYDVKGLLKAAIRDSNPVLCFDDSTLADLRGDVPSHDYIVPLGLADVKREGADLTIVAVGGSVKHSLEAARKLREENVSVEVIDIRSVAPLDRQTILQSVAKTRRLLAVDPAPGTCSVASEIAATVAEALHARLRCPIVRLTAPDVPVPFSKELEDLLYPSVDKILATARRMVSG